MDYTPEKIWEGVLAQVELEISKPNYNTWFKNTFAINQDGTTFMVGVPNEFNKEWLYTKFNKMIITTLRNFDKNIRNVEYIVQKKRPSSVEQFIPQKKEVVKESKNEKQAILGSFIFYPEQNKLMQKAKEITLSKKECELLEIFVANENLVVKREDLTKQVWEDNGVIVGRSLDTYISKLRKKLQEDTSIKLTNIHGVGYKLEVKR